VGSGGVLALFVIVLAAAEVGVGLAIILQYYRMRTAVVVDEVRLDDEERVAG
jgi:NADH-quinone oxidoreductase subunit K